MGISRRPFSSVRKRFFYIGLIRIGKGGGGGGIAVNVVGAVK